MSASGPPSQFCNLVNIETCVDDSRSEILEDLEHRPCEVNEEMVSSWTGISGVPGLGYSLPPKEACDLSETSSPAKSGKNGTSGSPWSANSAQNLASLKVDLPRVTNHHHHHHHYYPEVP